MTNTASISNQSTNNSVGSFYGKMRCQAKYYSSQHQTLFSQPDTSTTEHHFHFGSVVSSFLELFIIDLCSSPVAHWNPSNLRGSYSSVKKFAFSFCPWNSPNKNTGVNCRFLLQWTKFGQNSSLWHVHLGWPCMVQLIASLSYAARRGQAGGDKSKHWHFRNRWIEMDGMGEFNSDDHYVFYCRQESLRRNGVALIVNKRVWNAVLGYNLKKQQNDLGSFPRQTIQHHSNRSLCPNSLSKKLKLISSMKTYNTF